MNYETSMRTKVAAASILADRVIEKKIDVETTNFNKLSAEKTVAMRDDLIEKEASRIFYWILAILNDSIESTYPGRKQYKLTIFCIHNKIYVGNLYLPLAALYQFYCRNTKDFYSAVEKVVELFNQIKYYEASLTKYVLLIELNVEE